MVAPAQIESSRSQKALTAGLDRLASRRRMATIRRSMGRVPTLDAMERAAGELLGDGRRRQQCDPEPGQRHLRSRVDVVELEDALWRATGLAEQGVRQVVMDGRDR